jgi:hypothetical protein
MTHCNENNEIIFISSEKSERWNENDEKIYETNTVTLIFLKKTNSYNVFDGNPQNNHLNELFFSFFIP